MERFLATLVILLLIWGNADSFYLDQTKKETGYIEFNPGTLNIILAAPHGGSLRPSEIPDRDFGCLVGSSCVWNHECTPKDTTRCKATTVTDSHTKSLTEMMREEIYQIFGEYPTTVINLLQRRKLDANRDKPEATFGVPIAEEAWEEFHQYIDQSKASFTGPGLFFDIHGHGHREQWAELGYLLTASDLNSGNLDVNKTAIKSLYGRVGGDFEEILRGEISFGGYLQAEGFDSVPGPVYPSPSGGGYFSGGYNTRRHGSRDGGTVDAIQIESPSSFRAVDLRPAYAKALARAIYDFYQSHYQN